VKKSFSPPLLPLTVSRKSFPFPKTIGKRLSIRTENPSSFSKGFWRDYRAYTALNYVSLRYFNAAGASKSAANIIAWKLISFLAFSMPLRVRCLTRCLWY